MNVRCLVLLALAGCSEPPKPPSFLIAVKVESDPGRAIAGAYVARASRLLGTTDANGRATLSIDGIEGEITDVVVTCPDGYQSPTAPINLKLTRLAERTKIPEYSVRCPPAMRRVVVAVRADNGPNLPVLYLDRAVTRTDAAGAASFALEVPPGTQFSVALSTAERKDVKPINPSKMFLVSQQDEVFLFDQKFEVEKKKPVPVVVPHGPRAL